jgi:hypothetical protein
MIAMITMPYPSSMDHAMLEQRICGYWIHDTLRLVIKGKSLTRTGHERLSYQQNLNQGARIKPTQVFWDMVDIDLLLLLLLVFCDPLSPKTLRQWACKRWKTSKLLMLWFW